jgi:two-component system heavy metal sensor histidine kinase CusS
LTLRFGPASIAGTLTLMLGFVALTVFTVVGFLLHWSLQSDLREAERHELQDKMEVVQHYIAEAKDPMDLSDLRHHLDDVLIGSGTLRVWVLAPDGAVLYGGSRMPVVQTRSDGQLSITREDGITLFGLKQRNQTIATVSGASVLVGLDGRARRELLDRHDRTTAAVCAIGVILTMAVGAWLVRRGLWPVRLLAAEAEQIDPDSLEKRLPTRPRSSELASLVRSFNRALDRIDDAYQQLQGFSADVAHELRTPLASLISGTEVALSRTRSVEEMQDLLASNLDDLRALSSMVTDMLFLAHADQGEVANNLTRVLLLDEVSAVVDYLEASLEESGHTVTIEGDVQADVNSSLFRRALVNLISNAARYASAGQPIAVQLQLLDGVPRVLVTNAGAPISEPRRMFERFWRSDPARTNSSERHGLGLAIVRAVARMHGGDTFAHSRDGITTVGFTLASPTRQREQSDQRRGRPSEVAGGTTRRHANDAIDHPDDGSA